MTEDNKYPEISYNPPLSAETLKSAIVERPPTPVSDGLRGWARYLDNVKRDTSFGEPEILRKPVLGDYTVFETDVTTLEDAYGYVYEYLREFYETDAPWGTADDDVLDALERAINLVKKVTGHEEVGSKG